MKRALIALFLITACALAQAVVCFSEEKANLSYDMTVEILENEQAALIDTKVVYLNATGEKLSSVWFSAPFNVFRRESTLPYDNDTLEKAFPFGYAPGGGDIQGVYVNGEAADWAVSGDNEAYIRVEADVKSGDTAEIRFVYTLLLSENRAFLGSGDTDWRFSGFYPALLVFEDGDFATNAITRAGKSHYSDCADFQVRISLPPDYDIACAGEKTAEKTQGGKTVSARISSAREFSFVISRKFHKKEEKAASGVTVSAFGQDRYRLSEIGNWAKDAIDWFEKNIAPFPYASFTISIADLAGENLTSSGMAILENTEITENEIVRMVALQYFSDRVHPNPGMEAWMTDGLSEYMSILCIRHMRGEKAYRELLNERLLPSIGITIPGGLTPVSETARFQTIAEYEAVVSLRGAAALHEIELAMGEEAFLDAVKYYYSAYSYLQPTSDDFADAFEKASGRSWADAIYHWLYTIGDYQGENLYEYD